MPLILNGSTGISGTDGTAATPALQGTDTNTGVFFPAADTIAFAEGGTEVMRINSAAQVEYVAGSAAAPTIVPAGDTNTGMFFPAADTIAFAEGGVEALRLNASGNAVFAGTVQTAGITTNLYPLVQGTAVASIIGTFIDFTGIPSWVRRITVMFNGVSTSGTSSVLLQAGTSLGIQTSSYLGTVNDGDAAATNQQFSTGFSDNTSSAAIVRHGIYELCLLGSNTWACRFQTGFSNAAAVRQGAGSIALSGTLDRLRITTVGGTDTFDAGSINIMYE